jgi:DNA-binding winged helix-turn-helix (wHTH) protein
MAAPSTRRGIIRFGPFELDLSAREVRKEGRKVKLQEQPFHLLALLVQRPGEVVTREELQQALWPANTFVEFDHGLNTAIKKIRQALDDSAEAPQYIETLPRQGYRFLGPVEVSRVPAIEPSHGRIPGWFAVVFAAIAVGVTSAWFLFRTEPEDRIEPVPVTAYGGAETGPTLSPDGTQVAFTWDGEKRDNFDIYVKRIGSEVAHRLTTDPALDFGGLVSGRAPHRIPAATDAGHHRSVPDFAGGRS